MAWEWVGQLAPAAATVATALFGLARGQRKRRTDLKHDVETVKELPPDSDAYRALMSHIEWQIGRLRQIERDGQRDWSGTTLGFIMAIGLGYLTVWLFSQDAWWSWFGIPTAFFAAIGLYGIAESLTIKRREPRTRKNRQKKVNEVGPLSEVAPSSKSPATAD